MNQTPLFFDLETTRHPLVEKWIERQVPDLESISAPSNWKDPDKIEAYIEKAKADELAKVEAAYEESLSKAPLDPDLGAIRAIGLQAGREGEIGVMVVPQEVNNFKPPKTFGGGRWPREMNVAVYDSEKDMISDFWEVYRGAKGQTVGYNSISFDLPYLLRRSMELETAPLVRVDLRRYQLKPSTDLMGILYNWGRAKSMKFVCKRYGIENPNPEWDGSMVSEMTDTEVCQYVAGDIYMLTELHKKMSSAYGLGVSR
jgi:DNA polymerase elongation subunit (family B)